MSTPMDCEPAFASRQRCTTGAVAAVAGDEKLSVGKGLGDPGRHLELVREIRLGFRLSRSRQQTDHQGPPGEPGESRMIVIGGSSSNSGCPTKVS